MILYNAPFFFLETENTSYIMRLTEDGLLQHVYYGKKVARDDFSFYNIHRCWAFDAVVPGKNGPVSTNALPQEYPTFGRGDYRQPALIVEDKKGRRINYLTYVEHQQISGRPLLPGLPCLNENTQDVHTLIVTMADEITQAQVKLHYVVFPKEDIIARYTVVCNPTEGPLYLHKVDSISIDFERSGLDMISLEGAWARERYVARRPICQGITSIESRRGSSSAMLNPFAALADTETTETSGDVYGFAFVYSSDFKITAEGNQMAQTRLQVGLNPETFCWKLMPGEIFTTPEALMTYSGEGFGQMSRNFHRVCRSHLGNSAKKDLQHPIIVNNWEATYFDITEEKLEKLIKNSSGLGIDMFVLDDGWFGHRDLDNSSLGDWYVFAKKFPNGLQHIANMCKEHGMNFGIWFEPEMISQDSDLYRAHPDWCIHCEGVEPRESRNQLVLDLSRPDVVDNIYNQMAKILSEADIRYIKWDYNRNITDNGSEALPADRQLEHTHRQMLGAYDLMRRLTENFPHVFFEGCSGGGGRFDFGMLYYMPQTWTSDDSDAVERLKIQYGTSFVYPPQSMVGHVSASPNHQTGRATSFNTRGEIAQMCSYGYELDIGQLTDEERNQIKDQIAHHRELEALIRDGEFYRLQNPFTGNICAWELVSADCDRAYVMVAFKTTMAAAPAQYLRLQGLDANGKYRVVQMGITVSGDTLMNAGIPIVMPFGDYTVLAFDIIQEK